MNPHPASPPLTRPTMTEVKYWYAELARELEMDRSVGAISSEHLSQTDIAKAFSARKGARAKPTS